MVVLGTVCIRRQGHKETSIWGNMIRSVLILTVVLALQANCEKPSEETKGSVNINSAVVKTQPTTKADQEKPKVSDEKELLAKRFEQKDPDTAAIIRAPETKIDRIPTPFLKNGRIYKVSRFAPTRPINIFVGVDDKDLAIKLNANEVGYFELADKAGLNISNGESRIAYVLVFLETVVKKNNRLEVIDSIGQVKERPNLDAEKQKEFQAFVKQFESIVKPPKSIESGIVELYAVKGQDLVKMSASVSVGGKIDIKETILEKDLLIPYAM